jgi:hypothetical protein
MARSLQISILPSALLLIFQTKITSEVEVGTLESDKGTYHGETKNKQKHGWGKMQWRNGGFYQGQWSDNTKDGYGFQKWGIGTKWEGKKFLGNF